MKGARDLEGTVDERLKATRVDERFHSPDGRHPDAPPPSTRPGPSPSALARTVDPGAPLPAPTMLPEFRPVAPGPAEHAPSGLRARASKLPTLNSRMPPGAQVAPFLSHAPQAVPSRSGTRPRHSPDRAALVAIALLVLTMLVLLAAVVGFVIGRKSLHP